MKRIVFCVLLALLTVKTFPQAMTLDEAIRTTATELGQRIMSYRIPNISTSNQSIEQTAEEIRRQLAAKPVIAVLNFSSDWRELSTYVMDELNNAIVRNGTLAIVNRQDLEIIRKELDFQMNGDVSDESWKSKGKFRGAQFVLTGSFTVIGRNTYRFRIKVIDVETAVEQYNNSIDIKKDNVLTALMPKTPKPKGNETGNAFEAYSEWAYRDSVEYGTNHYVEWNEGYTGMYWEPVSIHWSFVPFTSVGLGAGFGFGNAGEDNAIIKAGVTPYAGLVIPLSKKVKFFGDGLMEIGYNNMGSFFGGSGIALNPGFDAGILFSFSNDDYGFNLRYKGLWTGDNGYINAFGIAVSENATKKSFNANAGRILAFSSLGVGITGIVGSTHLVNNGHPDGFALGIVGGLFGFMFFITGIIISAF